MFRCNTQLKENLPSSLAQEAVVKSSSIASCNAQRKRYCNSNTGSCSWYRRIAAREKSSEAHARRATVPLVL